MSDLPRFLRQTVFCGVCQEPVTERMDRTVREVNGIMRVVHRACRTKGDGSEQARTEG